MTFNWNLLNGTTPVVSQLASPNSTSSIQQDGTSSGTLVNFNIGSDGTITGSFSNGKTAIVGQIALASFADEQGLSRDGNNDFTPTLASGKPTIGGPGTGELGGVWAALSNNPTSISPASLLRSSWRSGVTKPTLVWSPPSIRWRRRRLR